MDETDTAQVAIFICDVDRDFTVVEELASAVELKDIPPETDLTQSQEVPTHLDLEAEHGDVVYYAEVRWFN
ncbi:hypothetical protein TNCV_3701831 [Trichonephila clavipes]|nr:hypothetical protein TNCV_3701831 [Trichonephila clavipes]